MSSYDYSNLGGTSRAFFKLNNQINEKETIISNQNRAIDKLKTELIKKHQENADLKLLRKNFISLEEQVKIIEDDMKKVNKEKLEIIKKRDEKYSLLKRKINELENVIKLEKLDYEKNTVLYKQKMSISNQILMENEIYSEEVEKLKSDLGEFEEQKKEEIKEEEINKIETSSNKKNI